MSVPPRISSAPNASGLLRLFQSDLFHSRLAIQYLYKYSDSIGIQYYLCHLLSKYDEDDITFLIPQLCHLLITRPTECMALEDFLLTRCESSEHMGIMMLWYVQCYVSDMQSSTSAVMFKQCSRLYHRIQLIIFEDPVKKKRKHFKIRENVKPAFAGLGVALASIASPALAQISAQMILTQGRSRLVSNQGMNGEDGDSSYTESRGASISDSIEGISEDNSPHPFEKRAPITSPSIDDLSNGHAFTSSRSSLSSFPVLERKNSGGSASMFGTMAGPNDQTPSKSIYCYNELQFALSLTGISDRLRSVPKIARQSTLIAELTLLNHNLPAQVCIPIWCSGRQNKAHHIVARIPPNEAVVLNSADRVPYLLFIETVSANDASLVMPSDTDSMDSHLSDTSESIDAPLTGSSTFGGINSELLYGSAMSNSQIHVGNGENLGSSDEDGFTASENDDYSVRMRTAAIMLAQLYNQQRSFPTGPQPKKNQTDSIAFETIRNRLLNEMATLEERRIRELEADRLNYAQSGVSYQKESEASRPTEGGATSIAVDKEDPSGAIFRENWDGKASRIAESSPYSRCPTWKLISVIVKSGADLRQEVLALQLIREMQRIWEQEKVAVWVHYYQVLVTSDQGGLIETIKNSISLHSIKKQGLEKEPFSLLKYFVQTYGPLESKKFLDAQEAFVRSLAGYSIVCYILQIKDRYMSVSYSLISLRHNGNILLDSEGHIVHIDFGFMLSNSPGSMGFELAPFKLPQEFVDLLGGSNGAKFQEYRRLCKDAFIAVRKHWDLIVGLVEVMEKDSNLPCFTGASTKPSTVYIPPSTNSFMNLFYSQDSSKEDGDRLKPGKSSLPKTAVGTNSSFPVSARLRERFVLGQTEAQVHSLVDRLIDSSLNSMFTNMYDLFQWYSNGVH
ncbi:Phosphatidylinositol 4-kinase pik1alpha (PI4-kinase)(PtdIns-4-kinase) [Dinochytrium kinnereticum]|nr:Phosphatidylinositol 4-kinase pik1alpha (PI4-kinase)(PtdIns-4-kinase) [Dinochytrium kinnereticum]